MAHSIPPTWVLIEGRQSDANFRIKGNDKMTNTNVSSNTSIKAEPRSESSACCRDIGIRAVAAAVRYQRMPACDAYPEGKQILFRQVDAGLTK
jgi:hypothetical protein